MLYADYNGSGQLLPEIREYLSQRIIDGPYANPNAIHSLGQKVGHGYEKCRKICADVLGADKRSVIFNSGSSEGISHVFFSVLTQTKKRTIITSGIEHSAVVQACQYFEKQGFNVIRVKSVESGVIDLEDFNKQMDAYSDDLALVSIMAANNETGVIQPWREIQKTCAKYGAPFFSDTTQYIGKTEFNFNESGMDYAVVSAHKVGGLVGCGFVLAKDPTQMIPYVFGGGQEHGLRGGTQNYIGVETLAIALQAFEKKKDKLATIQSWRENFEKNVKAAVPNVVIIGEAAPRLGTTTMISYPGLHGQAVQIELESEDIFVTTSSACSDNEPETSKVLKSMGIDDAVGRGVVRISLPGDAKQEDYNHLEKVLINAYKKLEKIYSF